MSDALYSPDGHTTLTVAAVLMAAIVTAALAVYTIHSRRGPGGKHRDGGLWLYWRQADDTLNGPWRCVAHPQWPTQATVKVDLIDRIMREPWPAPAAADPDWTQPILTAPLRRPLVCGTEELT